MNALVRRNTRSRITQEQFHQECSIINPATECEGIIEVNGHRNIVWKAPNGTTYHQDCTVTYPDHPGKSDFYRVT